MHSAQLVFARAVWCWCYCCNIFVCLSLFHFALKMMHLVCFAWWTVAIFVRTSYFVCFLFSQPEKSQFPLPNYNGQRWLATKQQNKINTKKYINYNSFLRSTDISAKKPGRISAVCVFKYVLFCLDSSVCAMHSVRLSHTHGQRHSSIRAGIKKLFRKFIKEKRKQMHKQV